KLVIPGAQGLPEMSGEENWYDEWKAIDPDKRGSMRTYSIREFCRAGEHGEGSNGEAELDIDFALHGVGTPDSGPAATWAVATKPGDQLYGVSPQKDDESGPGIEFQPRAATSGVILGDAT